MQQHAISELWKLTRDRDPVITVGVGQHQMWAAQFYKFVEAAHIGSAAAAWARWASACPPRWAPRRQFPDRLVIDIDGDGSFQMNIQELATCFCEKLPVKVLLLNNQHLGMVVQWEDRFMQGNRAHTYLGPIDHPEARGQGDGLGPSERYPNFVQIAKGYGCGAAYVRNKADLVRRSEEMINYAGPYVLDVEVPYQEHVLPMIPGGMTVRDMIKE